MAQVDPSTQPNPIVVILANMCCFGVLGYYMCGQLTKSLWLLGATIVLNLIGVGVVISLLGLWDSYMVAQALKNGEPVDENEYKVEILYKIMSLVDKSAVFKG